MCQPLPPSAEAPPRTFSSDRRHQRAILQQHRSYLHVGGLLRTHLRTRATAAAAGAAAAAPCFALDEREPPPLTLGGGGGGGVAGTGLVHVRDL